ncbi:hypothetical protein GCM10027066_04440 [Dyella jejuensis]
MDRAQAHFDLVERQIAEGSLIDWHLYQDGILCGGIRLNHIEANNRKAAVGYFIDVRYQGRGLVSRALAQLLNHAFEDLRFNRVELRCHASNIPSQHVAARAGFVLEGRLREACYSDNGFDDLFIFGLLASEHVSRDPKF